MSPLARALIVLVASAVPAAAERVLLADTDPELQRAVRATLAPWRVEVIVEAEVRPRDATDAQQIGDANTARFVVWREGANLVVFDRERNEAEHRGAPAGPLDAASAAAAALTVKTLMRLPAVPVDEAAPPVEPPPPPPVETPAPGPSPSPLVVRVQAGLASRAARGEDAMLGGRASAAVLVKPSALPLWLGIAGELGTEADVQGAGFKGTWRDWSVLGLASWSFALAEDWSLEPFAGGGVTRSSLDGSEMMVARHERETLTLLRGGLALRRTLGFVSIGGAVAFDGTLGTPAYTKNGMGAKVFEVPDVAISLGFVIAADLGH